MEASLIARLRRLRRWWYGFMHKRQEPRERILICMRLDEMWRVHPNQITDYCDKCGEAVGIYPSGQSILHQYPEIIVVCNHCNTDPYGQLAPGAEREPFESGPRDQGLRRMI